MGSCLQTPTMKTNIIFSIFIVASSRASAFSSLTSLEKTVGNMVERMEKMEAEMEAKDERIAALEAAQTRVDMGGWWECAWREEWTGVTLDNSNITYERLLFSQAGQEVEGAGLDINTGVFTAPYSAVWTVSYSATSVQYSGDIIQAFIHINGERIEASQYWASYFESAGRISSLGSRTLHLGLEAGDTLSLATGDEGHYGVFSGLWYITLCVSSDSDMRPQRRTGA